MSPLPGVSYQVQTFVVYDGASAGSGVTFLHPNTTTLVDVVLNRVEAATLLELKDGDLNPFTEGRAAGLREPAGLEPTGRARLLEEELP